MGFMYTILLDLLEFLHCQQVTPDYRHVLAIWVIYEASGFVTTPRSVYICIPFSIKYLYVNVYFL